MSALAGLVDKGLMAPDWATALAPVDAQIEALQQQLAAEPEMLPVRTHEPNPARLPLQTRLVELETALQGQIAAHNAAKAEFDAKKRTVDDLGPWEVLQAHLVNERDAVQSAYNALSV